VIDALMDRLDDDEVSGAACDSLTRIGRPALPAVLASSQADDPDVRAMAAQILFLMASQNGIRPGESQDQARDRNRAIRTALRSALGDRDERIRSVASSVLQKLGPSAVPDLIAALEDRSTAIRSGAARALGALRDDAREALDALRRHNDADPEVHRAVETAIRAIDESEHFELVVAPIDR
jgi:HEAT repeat protein